MPIVITGAQGQLGRELCRQWGPEAVGVDLPEFDLTSRDGVRAALGKLRPSVVVNTAAFTLVDRAEKEPESCQAVNVDGVRHLAEACRDLDCLLVQMSTDYVFGRDTSRTTPYRETDLPGPQGVYAQSKLDSERVAAQWDKHLIVRTCGLYGALGPRSAGNFVETMLRLAGTGRALRVVDDQHCTPSYVPQVTRAIRFLVHAGARGIYHVVNSGATTWHRFALEIFQQAGLEVTVEPITTAEYGAPAQRPGYSVLDTHKYHALSGCSAMPSWQEALAEYLALRSNRSV